jgi:plastocyanin
MRSDALRHSMWHGKRRMIAAAISVFFLCGVSPAAHAGGAVRTHVVVIDAMQYSPATVEVAAGDTVIWKNKDPFPHTVTAEDRSFDSHGIAAGGQWKFKARKKGTFPYVCTYHPTMKGQLVVK